VIYTCEWPLRAQEVGIRATESISRSPPPNFFEQALLLRYDAYGEPDACGCAHKRNGVSSSVDVIGPGRSGSTHYGTER